MCSHLVTVKIKDLNNNGSDGYYGSVAVLMVLQFGGGWNFSGTLPQNGILAPLLDLLASPQVKIGRKGKGGGQDDWIPETCMLNHPA